MSKVTFKSSASKSNKVIKLYGGNLEALQSRDKFVILVGAAGTGKASSNDTPIPTPNGWTTMGELKVGDFVFTQSGKITEILGVYPQGKKLSYKVTFSDGTSTECCDEHLWSVWTNWKRDKNKGNREISMDDLVIRTTKEIRETLHKEKYVIPICKPVFYPTRQLEIDPYIMGIIIGDGHIRNATLMFSSADEFIVNKVRSKLKDGLFLNKRKDRLYDYVIRTYGNRSPYNKYFRKFNTKILSNNKFIPREYLQNSKQNRIELLHGLIDSDGHISKKGHITYSTISEQLMKDVKELVQSLGGIVSHTYRKSYYIYKGERRQTQGHYTLFIGLPDDILPCSLPRKLERFRPRKYRLTRSIKSIEPTEVKEMTCISVDDASQIYLANDFLCLHNTFALCLKMHLYCMLYPGVRVLLCRKSLPALRNSVVKTYQDILELTHYTDRVRTLGETRPTEFHYQYDEKEHNGILYKGMSKIVLSQIDMQGKALGAEYDMVYVNQPDTEGLTEDEFTMIASRARLSNAPYRQIIADPNPASDQHWLLKGSLPQPITNQPKWKLINSYHKDNPKLYNQETEEWTELGQEHIAQLQLLPEHLRQSQLEGIWFSTEGSVFANSWNPGKHQISLSSRTALELGISTYNPNTEEYENRVPKDWHHYVSIDWGGGDPWAILLIGRHPKRDLFIVHRHIYIVEPDITRVAQLTKEMIDGYEIKDIIADRGRVETVYFQNYLGMTITNAEKGAGSAIDSINLCNTELLSDRWLFINTDESLFNEPSYELTSKKKLMGVEEIPNLKLDKKTGGIAKHQQDHFFDSWKYFVRYWNKMNNKPDLPSLIWL